jgi:hypothetical protein
MGKVLHFEYFRKIDVKRFEVNYDHAGYSNPTDLLADFIDGLGSIPCGQCSSDQDGGDYNVSLLDLDNNGEPVYVNFAYEGVSFKIREEHPRGGEISDLFVKHLIEKEIPWRLCEKRVSLDREVV